MICCEKYSCKTATKRFQGLSFKQLLAQQIQLQGLMIDFLRLLTRGLRKKQIQSRAEDHTQVKALCSCTAHAVFASIILALASARSARLHQVLLRPT